MIWPWQRKAERRRRRIVERLWVERAVAPKTHRGWYDDMILYADIGKDRLRLPDDWGTPTDEQVEKWQFVERLGKSQA